MRLTLARLQSGPLAGLARDRAQHAQQALDCLLLGEPIAHSLPADFDGQRFRKSAAAHHAQHLRDSVLRLALIDRFARHWPALANPSGSVIPSLCQVVLHQALHGPYGIRPLTSAGAPASPGHGAVLQQASSGHFLQDMLPGQAAALAQALGLDLSSLVPAHWAQEDPATVTQWYRAWTVVAALCPLTWIASRGVRDFGGLAEILWLDFGPSGIDPGHHQRLLPPFPSGRVRRSANGPSLRLRAELYLPPVLRQILGGHALPPSWIDEDPALAAEMPFILSLRNIDYLSVRGRVVYHGRSVFHCYFAVLAACLEGGEAHWPASALTNNVLAPLKRPVPSATQQRMQAGRPQTCPWPERWRINVMARSALTALPIPANGPPPAGVRVHMDAGEDGSLRFMLATDDPWLPSDTLWVDALLCWTDHRGVRHWSALEVASASPWHATLTQSAALGSDRLSAASLPRLLAAGQLRCTWSTHYGVGCTLLLDVGDV